MLSIKTGDLHDVSVEGPISSRFGNTYVCDLPEMAPESAVTFKIRGWSYGQCTLSAEVLVAGSDTTPADNSVSATVFFAFPPSDLAIHSVSAPTWIKAGDSFNVTFVITNAGPETATGSVLEWSDTSGLEFLGVVGDAFSTNQRPFLGAIAAGESKTVILSYRAKEAGLFSVVAQANGHVTDPQFQNNFRKAFVYSAPDQVNQVMTEFTWPAAITEWDRVRQQLIAAFPNDYRGILILDPSSLGPLARIPLPEQPRLIASCNDGTNVWVSLADATAVRVNLDSMSIVQRFNYDANPGPIWSIASPPGQSRTLLATLDPGNRGNSRVRVFDDGISRPEEWGLSAWPGAGVPIRFTLDGRLFLAASEELRELRLTPAGVSLVRDLDHAAVYSGASFSLAGNRLFFLEGRVVDLDSGTVVSSITSFEPHVADEETGLVYTGSGSRILFGGPPMILRAYSTDTLRSVWQLETPLPSSELTSILPMGTNGILLFGDKVRLVKPYYFGAPAADLGVTLTVAPVVDGRGIHFPIQLTTTNTSAWAASDAALTVELSSGLLFSDGYTGAGTNRATLLLGDLNGGTNVMLQAYPVTEGTFGITASVTSSVHDPVTDNNIQHSVTTVLKPPLLLLDDTSLPEDSLSAPGGFAAWLSRPAPTNVSASFVARLLTASEDDFQALSGQLHFSKGERRVMVPLVSWRGATAELDETAVMFLSVSNLSLVRTSVIVTVLNDDWPQLIVTNVAVQEGNSGGRDATFYAALSLSVPFPVEMSFSTVPTTARASLDFNSREGWLRFEPWEKVKTVTIPVLGDTDYEPDETAAFLLRADIGREILTGEALLTIRNDDLPAAPSLIIAREADGGLRFDFDTEFGATYQLQSRTNLTTDTWMSTAPAITGAGAGVSLRLAAPVDGEQYYRLNVR